MRAFIFIPIFFILIDLYTFRVIKNLDIIPTTNFSSVFFYVYWGLSLLILLGFLFTGFYASNITDVDVFHNIYYLTGAIAILYIPKIIICLFGVVDDVFYFLSYLIDNIVNSGFISSIKTFFETYRLFSRVGLGLGILIMLFVIHGIFIGRYNFIINNNKIESNKIPTEFNGFKIVQISDLHLGSFIGNKDKLEKAFSLVNSLKPDLILFTGDIINHMPEELDRFITQINSLKSKYGNYAILGNHDYSDYVQWEKEEDKAKATEKLIEIYKETDFELLMNQSVQIEKGKSKISIIGVENIGKPPFPKHGSLETALENTDKNDFKILLSHDPSHWDMEVKGKTDIDLTLSGHTHGMQFGFEAGNFKWSPVKFLYPKWNGMYKSGNQKLYVNVGLGFIGFPMRVGIFPEIAVFELQHVQNQ